MKTVRIKVAGKVILEKELVYELDEKLDILEQVCELRDDGVLDDDFENLSEGVINEISIRDSEDLTFEILED
jgi:hypothetical protein|nr:MAG TPA: hypothetical protein [Caudoviricetes sp.]